MDMPSADISDEALAALVQQGTKEAFGTLMNRYQQKLLRYGRKFLADETRVDEAVQDVFIKTYENIQSFDATRRFSPWIYRIAHNTFVNALRQKQRDPVTYLDLDTLVAHPAYEYDPAGEEERAHMQTLVEKGLETLSPAYREVIILYYLEGISYQEIADILQVPLGTVGVRLRRAREALKHYVDGK